MNNSESQTLEFKSTWNDECLRVISAFANSKGGRLIVGLNDHGQPVVLKNTNQLLEDIPNKIRNKLGIIPSVELEKTGDHELINITINPSSVPISYNGRFYLRSGSTVQNLHGKDLVDFLIRKTGMTWDDVVEDRGDFDSMDTDAIEDFKRYAVDRIPSIAKERDPVILLQKLNLIEKNKLKRAAILLFGKDPQRFYGQSVVKIGKFLSDTEIHSTDIVKGNLFRQLENTLEILRIKYLRSNIEFEGIHRRDILEYPYEALREAVINSLIHRDYIGTSQIQIRVYSDKLIIMNEGKLPPEVPVEQLKTDHLSRPKNRLLAEVFYYAGFIEAWGRGTLKIVEKCIEQELPEPDFKNQHGVMTVIFYRDIFTEKTLSKMGLNERQIKAVLYAKQKDSITNKEYRAITGIKERLATIELNDLVSKGIFEKHGTTGRGTFYAAVKAHKAQ